jgi:integrase/recombinase XerD
MRESPEHIPSHSDRTLFQILDALPEAVVLLDAQGKITGVNRAWNDLGTASGSASGPDCIGESYLSVGGGWLREARLEAAPLVVDTIGQILQGSHAECSATHELSIAARKRWFTVRVTPIDDVPSVRVLVTLQEITSLVQMQEAIRRASSVATRLSKRRARPLSDGDLQRIADACRTLSHRLVVFTLIDLGLRVSEFESFSQADFDWGASTVEIGRLAGDSRSRKRVLPLTERTSGLWRGHFARKQVFRMSTRQVQRIVRSVGVGAGLEALSPQRVRVTFAARLVERGASDAVLRYAMGYEPLGDVSTATVAELARLIGA